jgi:hypothetical protein
MHPLQPKQSMPPWGPVDAQPVDPQFVTRQQPVPQQSQPGQPGQPGPVPPQTAMMRASHADRERTTDVLKAAFAEGRLAPEEYNERVEQVYRAQTYGELSGIVQDLPSGPMPVPYLTPATVVPPVFAQPPYPYPAPFGYPQPYPQPYPQAFQVGPNAYAHARPYAYPYPHPAYPYVPPQPARRTNGLAVAALVLGIAEIWTMGLTALPALICGHIARGQLRERDENGAAMATTGIVLGWLAVAAWVVFILAGLAAFAHTSSGVAPVPAPALPGG